MALAPMVFDSFYHSGFDVPNMTGTVMGLWCSIRTFAKHATELGNQQPSEPVFFVKPNNCIQTEGAIQVSSHPGSVHHEVECVILLNQELQIDSIAVGLDLTDREVQSELRKEQLPWAKGKCFRASAVLGNFVSWDNTFESLSDPNTGLHLQLIVNGELRQSAPLSSMSISPAMQYESLIQWAPVQSGDYLFTGTPSGVAQLYPGDKVKATLQTTDGEVISVIESVCE
jgi:2-keto-4-pentenoate hydratase/2-oxohepta-3-ene-1,7-dioic acid hydratase in catechol pathway